MKIFLIISGVFLGIFALVILMLAVYSGKPLKRLLINAIIGFTAIALIDLTTKYTGVYVNINPITVLGTAVFSVPAVIGFLLLNVILM